MNPSLLAHFFSTVNTISGLWQRRHQEEPGGGFFCSCHMVHRGCLCTGVSGVESDGTLGGLSLSWTARVCSLRGTPVALVWWPPPQLYSGTEAHGGTPTSWGHFLWLPWSNHPPLQTTPSCVLHCPGCSPQPHLASPGCCCLLLTPAPVSATQHSGVLLHIFTMTRVRLQGWGEA